MNKGFTVEETSREDYYTVIFRDWNEELQKNVQVDEKALSRTEAIILSMTPYERENPGVINHSRKQRIAAGAGVQVQQINALLKQFDDMQKLMRQLTEDGAYEVPEELKEKIQSLFWAGCCGDDETKRTIGRVWQEHHYLCDTHTAVAWNVAQQYKAANPAHAPVVVLSTASPYKFPAAVLEGLGEKAEGDEFAVMEQLERLTGIPAPKNLRGLRERPVRHTTVLDREEMLPFVLEKAQEKKWF